MPSLTRKEMVPSAFHAIKRGDEILLKHWLNSGLPLNCMNQQGLEMIHLACLESRPNMVQLLLERGCDPNKPSREHLTPLCYACQAGCYNSVRILIERGADVNLKTSFFTPLHFAAQRGNEEIVLLLLEYEANPLIRMHPRGKTPTEIAKTARIRDYCLNFKAVRQQAINERQRRQQEYEEKRRQELEAQQRFYMESEEKKRLDEEEARRLQHIEYLMSLKRAAEEEDQEYMKEDPAYMKNDPSRLKFLPPPPAITNTPSLMEMNKRTSSAQLLPPPPAPYTASQSSSSIIAVSTGYSNPANYTQNNNNNNNNNYNNPALSSSSGYSAPSTQYAPPTASASRPSKSARAPSPSLRPAPQEPLVAERSRSGTKGDNRKDWFLTGGGPDAIAPPAHNNQEPRNWFLEDGEETEETTPRDRAQVNQAAERKEKDWFMTNTVYEDKGVPAPSPARAPPPVKPNLPARKSAVAQAPLIAAEANTGWSIPEDQLEFTDKMLGSGAFGEVIVANWYGTPVAVKKLLSGNLTPDAMTSFYAEIDILKTLRHPNIVQFLGACLRKPNICIVMELVEGGSLFDFLHVEQRPLSRKKQYEVALGIARGITYLHGQTPPLIHRDIKSMNILLDHGMKPKITDFGITKAKSEFAVKTNAVGTIQWSAPEIIKGEDKITEKSDTYSYGCVIYEVFSRKIPWEDFDRNSLYHIIVVEERRPTWSLQFESANEEDSHIKDLIERCWLTDPESRPPLSAIVARIQEMIEYFGSAHGLELSEQLEYLPPPSPRPAEGQSMFFEEDSPRGNTITLDNRKPPKAPTAKIETNTYSNFFEEDPTAEVREDNKQSYKSIHKAVSTEVIAARLVVDEEAPKKRVEELRPQSDAPESSHSGFVSSGYGGPPTLDQGVLAPPRSVQLNQNLPPPPPVLKRPGTENVSPVKPSTIAPVPALPSIASQNVQANNQYDSNQYQGLPPRFTTQPPPPLSLPPPPSPYSPQQSIPPTSSLPKPPGTAVAAAHKTGVLPRIPQTAIPAERKGSSPLPPSWQGTGALPPVPQQSNVIPQYSAPNKPPPAVPVERKGSLPQPVISAQGTVYPAPQAQYQSGRIPGPQTVQQYPTAGTQYQTQAQYQTGSQQYQTGSQQYQTGSQQYQTASQQYQTGSQQYPTGTQQYPTVSQQYQTGTQQYPTGTQQYPQQYQTASQQYQTGSRSGNATPTQSQQYESGYQGNTALTPSTLPQPNAPTLPTSVLSYALSQRRAATEDSESTSDDSDIQEVNVVW